MTTREWRVYLGFLGRHKRYAAGVAALVLICISLLFLEPLFLMVFTNEAVLKTNLNLLIALVVAMVAVGLASNYAYGVAKFHRARLGQRILADVRQSLLERLFRQTPSYFEEHPPGDLVAVAAAEVESLDAIHHALFFGAGTFVGIVGMLALCCVLDPVLGLLTMLPSATALIFLPLDGRMRRHCEAALGLQARMISFFKLHLTHVATTQAFGREESDLRDFSGLTRELVLARSRTECLAEVQRRALDVFRAVFLALLLLVGGTRVIRSDGLTLGVLLAVYAYAECLFREAKDLFLYVVSARLAWTALGRIVALIDAEPAVQDAPVAAALERARGEVEFEDVGFRYAPDAPWAVRDVSFSASTGQTIAIVGLSGSGKSTLFKLLLRFQEPTRGAIRLDGQDIKRIRLADLRRQFALASQEAALFDASVAENIRYGREDATDEEVARAARTAGADEFIAKLPSGLATGLAEDGARLSGGQRHRIALARALVRGAPVLLLDEFSAGLDAKTEALVQSALEELAPERTTLVIAHRLSTVLRADRILVMDRGRIVQSGTHAQLHAQRQGLYRFLFDRQFKDALATVSRAPALSA